MRCAVCPAAPATWTCTGLPLRRTPPWRVASSGTGRTRTWWLRPRGRTGSRWVCGQVGTRKARGNRVRRQGGMEALVGGGECAGSWGATCGVLGQRRHGTCSGNQGGGPGGGPVWTLILLWMLDMGQVCAGCVAPRWYFCKLSHSLHHLAAWGRGPYQKVHTCITASISGS